MKKSKIIKWKKRIGIFIVTFSICMDISGRIFRPKWRTGLDCRVGTRIRGYQDEKKDSIDVLFIGNSYFFRSIKPMDMYARSGITSYVYASLGQRLPMTYYYLVNALKTQSPKVVFIGVDQAFSVLKSADDENIEKTVIDMPFNLNKLEVLTDSNVFGGRKAQLVSCYPTLKYFKRIGKLHQEDFEYAFGSEHCVYKGYDPMFAVDSGMNCEYMSKNIKDEDRYLNCINSYGNYLDKVVELCKKNNIDIRLLQVPNSAIWNEKRHEVIEKYAKSKDITFIDLNKEQKKVGIDWRKDTNDGGDHLNIYGATKVTKYINDYLDKNVKLPNHKEQKGYEQWDNDLLENYKMIKKEKEVYDLVEKIQNKKKK